MEGGYGMDRCICMDEVRSKPNTLYCYSGFGGVFGVEMIGQAVGRRHDLHLTWDFPVLF